MNIMDFKNAEEMVQKTRKEPYELLLIIDEEIKKLLRR